MSYQYLGRRSRTIVIDARKDTGAITAGTTSATIIETIDHYLIKAIVMQVSRTGGSAVKRVGYEIRIGPPPSQTDEVLTNQTFSLAPAASLTKRIELIPPVELKPGNFPRATTKFTDGLAAGEEHSINSELEVV